MKHTDRLSPAAPCKRCGKSHPLWHDCQGGPVQWEPVQSELECDILTATVDSIRLEAWRVLDFAKSTAWRATSGDAIIAEHVQTYRDLDRACEDALQWLESLTPNGRALLHPRIIVPTVAPSAN